MRIRAIGAAVLVGVSLSGSLAACGSTSSTSGASSGGDTIKIGASIPLSGPLAGFGSFQKWGYQRAVDEVNAQGGISVDGTKKKVELKVLDDKTDPNTTSANVSRLITQDKVDALLGSCTPALVNAGALIADRNRVPMVTGCDPLGAFTSVKKWTHVWDIFFSEADLSALPFQTMKNLGLDAKTNKRFAILHDNGPDGQIVGGKLGPQTAKRYGFTTVLNESFPTDATQFSSLMGALKSANADVVFVDAVTPQAVAIRKQMASANIRPKVLIMEKGGEPVQFAQALGGLADGVLVGGYWDPSLPYAGAKTLGADFERETGKTQSQHIADSNAAAAVLLDAFAATGSTDKEQVNTAIGKTDKTYVVGPVKFAPDHTAKLDLVQLQWQGGKSVVVGPTEDVQTGDFAFGGLK